MPVTQENKVIEQVLTYRCPRYDDLPDILLYRDQVIDATRQWTAPLLGQDGVITPAMVNNYVKLGLVDAPEKKRYGRRQLAQLYSISLLKQVLSISEMRSLFELQDQTYDLKQAYDFFCTELENALQATFLTRNFYLPSTAQEITKGSELLRSTVFCFASKLFTLKFLEMAANSDIDLTESLAP